MEHASYDVALWDSWPARAGAFPFFSEVLCAPGVLEALEQAMHSAGVVSVAYATVAGPFTSSAQALRPGPSSVHAIARFGYYAVSVSEREVGV